MPCYQHKDQKPASGMVWGSVSAQGMTNLHIYDGSVNSIKMYIQHMLSSRMCLFFRNVSYAAEQYQVTRCSPYLTWLQQVVATKKPKGIGQNSPFCPANNPKSKPYFFYQDKVANSAPPAPLPVDASFWFKHKSSNIHKCLTEKQIQFILKSFVLHLHDVVPTQLKPQLVDPGIVAFVSHFSAFLKVEVVPFCLAHCVCCIVNAVTR